LVKDGVRDKGGLTGAFVPHDQFTLAKTDGIMASRTLMRFPAFLERLAHQDRRRSGKMGFSFQTRWGQASRGSARGPHNAADEFLPHRGLKRFYGRDRLVACLDLVCFLDDQDLGLLLVETHIIPMVP